VTGRTEFKFEIGHIAVSDRVLHMMQDSEGFDDFVWESFARHFICDWGDLPSDEKELNDENLEAGGQLFSQYKHSEYGELGILTEEDRSKTVVGFADEWIV